MYLQCSNQIGQYLHECRLLEENGEYVLYNLFNWRKKDEFCIFALLQNISLFYNGMASGAILNSVQANLFQLLLMIESRY